MKISLITVCLNNAVTIESAMKSVFGQTYKDIEYILVDGSSSDGTLELIKKDHDKIQTFLSEPDHGLYDALNKGIGLATGEIIGFIHADDLYASEKIIASVAETFETTGADAVYGDLVYVHKDNTDKVIRYWKSNPFKASLLKKGWMPPHPAFFVKSELYNKYGVFDSSFRISADYDLMLRFLGKPEVKAVYLPELIVRMRIGGLSNKSPKNILLKMREDLRAIHKNKAGNLFTLLRKNTSKLKQFLR